VHHDSIQIEFTTKQTEDVQCVSQNLT